MARRKVDVRAEAFIRKIAASDYAQLAILDEAAEIVHLYDNPTPARMALLDIDNKGENNKSAKLTEARVRAIKARLAKPHDHGLYARMAREEGVTPQCIYNIRDGVSWKHVKV